jgi:hypothetical protein
VALAVAVLGKGQALAVVEQLIKEMAVGHQRVVVVVAAERVQLVPMLALVQQAAMAAMG